jgi:hypothetical protein
MRMSAFLSLAFLVFCVFAISSSAQTGSTDYSQRARGVELYHQQKYREAAGLLKQAVKQDKSDADAWYYLGLTLLQDPKAIKAYLRRSGTGQRRDRHGCVEMRFRC